MLNKKKYLNIDSTIYIYMTRIFDFNNFKIE